MAAPERVQSADIRKAISLFVIAVVYGAAGLNSLLCCSGYYTGECCQGCGGSTQIVSEIKEVSSQETYKEHSGWKLPESNANTSPGNINIDFKGMMRCCARSGYASSPVALPQSLVDPGNPPRSSTPSGAFSPAPQESIASSHTPYRSIATTYLRCCVLLI